ncbi:MAG: hypothetical protein ACOYJK_08975 [Prevotella sp.]|jgi:hypothetical protein
MNKIFFLSLLILILVACTNKQSNGMNAELEANTERVIEEGTQKIEFAVKEKSYIYKAPKSNEKVLNQKATDALAETTYCEISRECLVKILETKGDWVKIQVINPEWLQESHVGWVKKSCIEIDEKNNQVIVQEGKDYEIMLKEKKGTVTNYYIKNITCKLNDSDLYRFAKAIKEQLGDECNIEIYASDKVKNLMTKYPLRGQEYIKVADEFVYLLSFDGTYSYYPLQDIQYKEFGGKNWKKEPVE